MNAEKAMRNPQSALALMFLGGAVLATAPAFAEYRHTYVGPPAVVAPPVIVAPPVAMAPPVVAVEPYAPEVIEEPIVPVAPPVVGYAPPVIPAPVPEAEFDYGPPAGPPLEVGGY